MKATITRWDFHDGFKKMCREDNFSYAGRNALFDYLDEYEDNTGEEIEFNVIALCCGYTEYKDLKEVQKEYKDIETLDDLRDNTQVIEFDGGLIIQAY